MARKAMLERNERNLNDPQKKVKHRNRCKICGRPRGYMRKFGICRICFRELAGKGMLPGVKKSSW
jgi:small subunit ribosomal protein S14